MEQNNEMFTYNYSAVQQEELDLIRKKYEPEKSFEELDKMEQLRKLDAGTTKKPLIVSLIVGVIGSLIMGLGMSLTMTNLGDALGTAAFGLGIIIGIIGMVGVIAAYPLYRHILRKEQERIAPQILQLIKELSQ